MTKRNLAALAAVVVAAGLSGCGGDDGGGGSTSLTNYNTGPVPSSPAVGAAGTRTLLPSTADTHEVETDGTWIVWKGRQINVGYYNGSTYANLNLGLGGAVTPWAFNDCERSPIAYDGTRIAFIANDVSDAAGPAFYYGAPGSSMRKIALPVEVTTQYLADLGVTIYGDAAGFADMSVDPARLWRVDLSAATPAFVEVSYTGDFTESPPGLGLVPLATADGLALLDISDGTARSLTGDGVAGTSAYQVRYANGAFTWIEDNKAYFYAPGFSTGDDSQLIAAAQNGTSTQSNPVAGPYNTYVMWQEYDSNTGVTTVKQRPWAQLGMTPNGGTIVIRNHQPALWAAISPNGGLQSIKTGMGFIAWLGSDTDGYVQLFTYFVGQPVPSPLNVVQVTSDEGSGWGNSDDVFLEVEGNNVFFKQEFTELHSPGRVFKRFDYAAQAMTTLVDGREFQQLPMAIVSGGKAIVLTRDHSFRLFARKAGSSGAPVVVTPKSQDVKNFQIAGGQLVYMALDREIYLDNEFLHDYVNDNDNAEFLVEIYAHDLGAGGAPERLTYNAFEDQAPSTDGDWVTWYDDNGWAYAQELATGRLQLIGETGGEVPVDGGLAAWRDNNSYVRYADLATGESAVISSQQAWDCPAVAGRIITWATGTYIDWPTGYSTAAWYYDLDAETPAEVQIAGAAPGYMSGGTYYYVPVPLATDGRFITWVEQKTWDPDDAGTVYPGPIATNLVAYYDVTTEEVAVVPAADWNFTGVGAPGWDGNEGPVCNPKISNGVIAFAALEYGAENLADDPTQYYGDSKDKEIFTYDAALAPAAVTRVTSDEDGLGLWDSRLRVGGNLAVWRAGGASGWGWDGKVPAVTKLK